MNRGTFQGTMPMKNVVSLAACVIAAFAVSVGSPAVALTPSTYLGTTSGTTINGETWGLWMGNWNNGYSGNDASYIGTINSTAANDGRIYCDLTDLFIADSDGKIGSLTMTSGTLQAPMALPSNTRTMVIGSGYVGGRGVFQQSGGTFYMSSGEMRLGEFRSAAGAGDGLYDISGGLFSTTGGLQPGGNVVLHRSNQPIASGTSRAELRISGSAVVDLGVPDDVAVSLGFGPGSGEGSSILTVIGSQASINIASMRMDFTATIGGVVPNSGVINYSFDESGVSTINITGTGASLAQGYLDVNYTGASITSGTTFTLMDTGTSGGAITMASTFTLRPEDRANWQLDLVDTNKALRLTYTGSTILGAITINVGSGTTQTQTQAGYPTLSGSLPLVKTGGGTLVITAANTLTGSTSVQQGTLQLANAAALASSKVIPLAGGTVSLAPYLQTTVGDLAPNAGGLVDLANGLVTVASGLSPTDLVTAIVAGRGDGSWTGTSGITSSVAASDVAVSLPRAVGWLDNGDGSVTAAYAAPGDTNLDWQVDVLDASNFLSFGKFDSGLAATWLEGDFNYDGVVDVLDAADFFGTGLYDAGNYNTPPGASGIAAVPEPSAATLAALAVAGWVAIGQARRMQSCRRSKR
jgi:fibronectin-binding autotransporter adhesin